MLNMFAYVIYTGYVYRVHKNLIISKSNGARNNLNKNMDTNQEEDSVELPPDTLNILNEFLMNKISNTSFECNQDFFEEDWQLSQFWYSEATKRILSKVCLELILKHNQSKDNIKIALLSCPSLYKSIKSIHPNGTVRLFEFDQRFSVYGDDFVPYDYKELDEKSLADYQSYFDILVADPPFLSKECIEKTGNIIKKLKKDNANIIICSGKIAGTWIKESLDLNQCKFHPEHARNLANEFCSYANFDLDSML